MQTSPQAQPIPNQQIASFTVLWQEGKWGRFLRLSEPVFRSRGGTSSERCLIFLLRCHAARCLHDPKEFARSFDGYRQARSRLTPKERAVLDRLTFQGYLPAHYQNPRYKRRPDFVMPAAALQKRGLNPNGLALVRKGAQESLSEALYIWHDGAIIAEEYFNAPQEPIGIMSLTKPVVAMAIGRLLDMGKLKSLDQLASDFYPQWKADERRRRITLRHLLTHTAGLAPQADMPAEKRVAEFQRIFADLVSHALQVSIVAEPGTQWEYSNPALYLLADIVRKASGKRSDAFVKAEFFDPMGIVDWEWTADPKGNLEGAGGIGLGANDLAKIGILMLDGGMWKGRRLLSASFVKESLRDQTHDASPGGINIKDAPPLGLIWFLEMQQQQVFTAEIRAKWQERRVPEVQIAKILPYLDKPMPRTEYAALVNRLYGVKDANDLAGWRKALGFSGFLPTAAEASPCLAAFFHTGAYGQYLTVLPQKRLVGVRQVLHKDLSDRNADGSYSAFNHHFAWVTGKEIWPMNG